MTFFDALWLDDAAFKVYVAETNAAWRRKMIDEGMVYFPAIDRWFPQGTQIAGVEPEQN